MAALIAGCPSLGDGGGAGTRSDSPPSLSTFATVVEQADSRQPLTVDIGVENQASRGVRLVPGGRSRPLSDLPRLQGPAELVLLPEGSTSVDALELTSEPVDGCWRFRTEDGDPAAKLAVSTSFPTTLDAGGRYAVRHVVYQAGTPEACLPAGEYRATHSLRAGEPETRTEFSVTFTVVVNEQGVAEMRATSRESTGE